MSVGLITCHQSSVCDDVAIHANTGWKPWDIDELRMLVRLYRMHGTAWIKVAGIMKKQTGRHRSQIQVKNKMNALLRYHPTWRHTAACTAPPHDLESVDLRDLTSARRNEARPIVDQAEELQELCSGGTNLEANPVEDEDYVAPAAGVAMSPDMPAVSPLYRMTIKPSPAPVEPLPIRPLTDADLSLPVQPQYFGLTPPATSVGLRPGPPFPDFNHQWDMGYGLGIGEYNDDLAAVTGWVSAVSVSKVAADPPRDTPTLNTDPTQGQGQNDAPALAPITNLPVQEHRASKVLNAHLRRPMSPNRPTSVIFLDSIDESTCRPFDDAPLLPMMKRAVTFADMTPGIMDIFGCM